ncbi:SDR family NAD(P)-dependent oxidoreductase [Myxococcus stipitatus]|uniref:type I polyketide synthase n=1 Tax=Myxococcus stipitatus TaxID=83455 RepID=UPI001F383197|nr:type I polyketide synthase [Myxococcus stipitatus]MCE9667447.1 SDR family NAD(P)-dependent oxidoreductase [Myxococcus stipitatus]
MARHTRYEGDPGLAVAIVGMAARVPGAEDVEAFWRMLREGVEGISFFTEEAMKALGVEPGWLAQPHFVRAAPVLERPGRFDAAFFGYAPREAELMDPQHRVFLECAWKALEHAGYAPGRLPGSTGVFAGSSLSSYLLFNLLSRAEFQQAEDTFPAMVGNDKDFLATRVAYHFNLKGPALTVQTGCSTSLVATHLACQALLGYQCDLALAGGVSVHMPQRSGYHHQEGGITSPDGHCRAFDAKGQGTLFGSGAGVVVLKRLEDALADGDTIHAVIRGSAINNDGAVKVGFTAPGVEGQAEVITRAQAVAEVSPESITYVEAHGTATPLGDPVEVQALTQAFRAGTERRGYCGLGSVKTNVGHLDAAAGVAGLLKTVLALEHAELPPSLHFEKPNPRIDFDNSPFYVNGTLRPWPEGDTPRRAGVSSFGIGGTNAHVILEEAPVMEPGGAARPWQLLTLSAKTPTALEAQTTALLSHLRAHPEQQLADVAWTLQTGRKPMEFRRVVVCADRDSALATLSSRDPQRLFTLAPGNAAPSAVFMFPGGGAQYPDMGRGLYASEKVFREAVDRCCELLRPRLGFDLRPVMYPDAAAATDAVQRLKRTSLALPALFTVEYALAQLWQSWGVRPEALIGHSLGEYAAACLAGVFSLEDALALVVLRGKLFEELPGGGMLSVPLPESEVRPLLGTTLSIAAMNGPAQCAVAGSVEAVEALAAELTRREVEFRHIPIDVAAHSHLVEPLLARFQAFVGTLRRNPPSLPIVSNVSGTWMTPEEAVDPAYWARHLRQTVRFGDGIRTLAAQPGRIYLEVGPGRTLGTLARLQLTGPNAPAVLSSLRHPQDPVADDEFLTTTVGRLWASGGEVDWSAVHGGVRRLRVPLPTYPFEGQDYWLAPEAPSSRRKGVARKSPDVASWFHLPSWQRAPLPLPGAGEEKPLGWLVYQDAEGLGAALAERLERRGHGVVRVTPGARFQQETERHFTVDPRVREDHEQLLRALKANAFQVRRVVYLWSLDGGAATDFDAAQDRGFFGVLRVAQALSGAELPEPVSMTVVGREALEVESADVVAPERATLPALCKVIPQELDTLSCRYVDLRAPTVDALVREVTAQVADPVVAWRGPHRHVQAYEPMRIEADTPAAVPLVSRGVYLITGGLGGVGLRLAEFLARRHQARLVLVGRSGVGEDQDGHRQQAVRALEAVGAEVLVARADVADEAQLRAVLAQAEARFGALHGVIHAAGLAGDAAVALLGGMEPSTCAPVFHAKVHGTYALERALAGRSLDFVLLVSSNASVLGGLGLGAYAAANAFLDAFATMRSRRPGPRWSSVTWDGWPAEASGAGKTVQTSIDQFAMSPAEAVEAFRRVVESPLAGQVVVSTGNLDARVAQWVRREGAGGKKEGGGTLHARPTLGTEYVAPTDDVEHALVRVWQEQLGLEQLGIHDNFFDLGGNSLLWLKIVGRLKRELGRDVPLTSVFEAPTVATLAKKLGTAPAQAEAPVFETSQSRGAQRRERRNRRE